MNSVMTPAHVNLTPPELRLGAAGLFSCRAGLRTERRTETEQRGAERSSITPTGRGRPEKGQREGWRKGGRKESFM